MNKKNTWGCLWFYLLPWKFHWTGQELFLYKGVLYFGAATNL